MSSTTLEYAVRLLSRRDHSIYEMQQKLKLRQCPPDEITAAINYCLENDWLNDQRFAASFLRLGVSKGHGWQRICFDAKSKGINSALIEQAEKNAPHDWFELAKELALKRFADIHGTLPDVDYKQRAKWFRYLQYRGFSFDEINYALSHP